jgi:transcriptional regulator with XRE-family HTH domain
MSLSDQVRRAIDAAGVTRYRIAKTAGVDHAVMSRFMAGKVGLSTKSLDALAAVLGLDVVARGPAKVLPPGRPGRKPKAKKGGAS